MILFAENETTNTFNTVLQRIGQYFGEFGKYVINLWFTALQWIGDILIEIYIGVLQAVLESMPGFSSESAYRTAQEVRTILASWNILFPIEESLVCINAILTWRILIGIRRAWMTLKWHASNVINLGGS